MTNDKKQTFDSIEIACVRRACAHLSEEEIIQAENAFKAYMEIVADIVDDMQEESFDRSEDAY